MEQCEEIHNDIVEWLQKLARGLYPEFREFVPHRTSEIRRMLQNIDEILEDPRRFREQLANVLAGIRNAIDRLAEIGTLLRLPPIETRLKVKATRIYPYSFSVMQKQHEDVCLDIMTLLGQRSVEDTMLAKARAAEFLARSPDAADAHAVTARVFIRLDEFDDAERELGELTERWPNHPEIPLLSILIAKRRDKLEQAFEYARDACEKYKDDPRFWRELGYLYWFQKEGNQSVDEGLPISHLDNAIQHATHALELSAGDKTFRMWILNDLAYYLAQRSESDEDIEKAIDYISEAIDIQASVKVEIRHFLWDTQGYVYLQAYRRRQKRDSLRKAWESFLKAVEANPDSKYAQAHFKECGELLFGTT